MNILIAYLSKYGSARQYAQWLHEELGGDLVDLSQVDVPDLKQ